MTRLTTTTLTLAIALAAAACGTDGPGGSSWTGGRADGFGDGGGCASATEMIAAARAQLVQDEPDFYSPGDFVDEMSLAETMEDLNGDGVADLLVFPGQSYAGSNAEQMVYLTDGSGCATIYVGHFGASGVMATEDGATTNGVRDVQVVNTHACGATMTRYVFDGARYVETDDVVVENLCGGGDCGSDDELIAAARAQLVADEPDFYQLEQFSDDVAFVEPIEDLNGDGVDDALVFPGWSYAGANTEQAVYLSDAEGCATAYAGHFGASSVSPAEDGAVTNGVRDLTVVNTSGCSALVSRYAFDGQLYVETGSETQNLCD